MAISKTYLDLQLRIAEELGDRSDLLQPLISTNSNSPIKRAIQSAIAKWEREPFYFTEDRDGVFFSTVAGQTDYTSVDNADIATSPEIWDLRLESGNNRYVLRKRTYHEIREMLTNTAYRSRPTDWSYFGKTLKLYPIPDAVYVIQSMRISTQTALSADTDTNIWTTDAFDLIRCEALLTLARDVLRDDELANRMMNAIHGPRGYLAALRGQTARLAKARVRATRF